MMHIGILGAAGRSYGSFVKSPLDQPSEIRFGPLAMRINRDLADDLRSFLQAIAFKAGFASSSELASNTKRLCVAMSGVFLETERLLVGRLLRENGFDNPDSIIVCEDICALTRAEDFNYGLLVTVSTGSNVAFYHSPTHYQSVGGWGSELADQGSGYYLGREALIRILNDQDGRKPATSAFVKAILDRLELSTARHVLYWFYEVRDTKFWRIKIADLAFVVTELAEHEDLTAQSILNMGRNEIVLSVRAALTLASKQKDSFHSEVPVLLSGTLATEPTLYYPAIIQELETFSSELDQQSGQHVTFRPRKAIASYPKGALQLALDEPS